MGDESVAIPRKALYLTLFFVLLLCAVLGYPLVKAPSNVAFLGDSLTYGWYFPRVNLGVFGNTTEQMKARFDALIPGHHYRRVVILGGTNDVLTKVAPEVTIHNLETMAAAIVNDGAQPVICEIPPIFHDYHLEDQFDYSNNVRELNRRIAEMAAKHQWTLVDYYDPLLGHPDYSVDGVHMRLRGYALMERAYLRDSHAF